MKKIFIYATLAFVTSLIYSCKQKEASPDIKIASNEIEVVSGVLVIDSEKSFRKLIDDYSKDNNYLDKILLKFPTFVNFNNKFKELKEQDYEEIAKTKNIGKFIDLVNIRNFENEFEIVPNIEISFFAKICSKDGYLYINNSLYKFEKDYVYIKSNIQKDKISSEISSGAFKKTADKKNLKDVSMNKNAKKLDIQPDCHTVYDGNKAFVARSAFYSSYLFNNSQFSFSEYQVQHRKRTLGVWFNSNAPTLSMNAFFQCSGNTAPYYEVQFNESCNSCSQITRAAPLDQGTYVKGNTTVSGTGTDGSYRTCSVYTNTWP